MNGRVLLIAIVAPTLAGTSRAQSYFEARNSAMGGAGVASSRYKAAGFANPALLTRFGESDDFGILLPTVGAFADDETGLADDLQNFTDEFDRIDALVQNATVTPGDLDLLAAALGALDGRQLT
ncbi:MAG: conjugal transfer protein TraF, partial [Planctomycetes bacterium]|nr:conjugal transfer protein TraF [Planctomycetota bacterium]